MKLAVRIITWYAVLTTPMIAVLYTDGSILSATMAIVTLVVVSFFAFRNIVAICERNDRLAGHVADIERMKKDFISHVSHELKAPLASMQETTNLMLERIPGPLSQKQERLLHLNLESGKRLAAMIGNLLDLSRLEAGVVDYEMQAQDAGELAESVIEELRANAFEKGIRVVKDIAPEPLPVHVDPNRIVQVLSNLLDNAIRFSPKGGTVHVRVKRTDDHILIAVGDCGPGIEDSHKRAVFDTFHQIKQGKKTLGQSMGLGLAISRALVEAHNGTIWVDDNPGGGSLFCLSLPRAHRQPAALQRAS